MIADLARLAARLCAAVNAETAGGRILLHGGSGRLI